MSAIKRRTLHAPTNYYELLLNAINSEIKFLARIELINGAGNGERSIRPCRVHQGATVDFKCE
jgi:hypothetical protein